MRRAMGTARWALGWAALAALATGAAACGSDGGGGGDASADDAMDAAGPGDDADAAGDDAADGGCEDGAWTCSADAWVLSRCVGGAWAETACWADEGRLCEAGACVDPWRYGSPAWSTCPDEPRATAETLAEKAASYDDLAVRLHLRPGLDWIMSVTLSQDGGVVPESEATWEDVATWHTGENDGLWNGLYMASQAFRYAVTRDPEVLALVKRLLAAEVTRMRITGVSGVFTRQYVPPGIPGIACPEDDAAYTTDAEKDDNRWVRIGQDGCATVVDRETGEWVVTDHCGLDAYAGWCFLDNVSQDEYAGHMMALAALVKLVDDPEVQATARGLVEEVAVHLMDNDLTFVDWDGRVTEHGKLYATSIANAPGFLAAQALAYVRMAVEATGREDLRAFLYQCLLEQDGPEPCLPWPFETGDPYPDWLYFMAVFAGEDGCKSNFNNFSMISTYLFDLLWYERDPLIRAPAQKAMDEEIYRADNARALLAQKNPWYDFIWAVSKPLGPGTDGPALDAIHDAVCGLKQFPASKARPTKTPSALYPHACDGRLGDSQAAEPIPVADRCPRTFLWWSSPYARRDCTAAPHEITQPADYLLAYWMGRYYGFIPADL